MMFDDAMYKIVRTFVAEEKFGLLKKMITRAVSFPSHIVRVAACLYTIEMIQFLYISLTPLAKFETQI